MPAKLLFPIALLLALVAQGIPTARSAENASLKRVAESLAGDVNLAPVGTLSTKAPRTFIVTHGLGGTRPGDRFHQLASELKTRFPQANVVRLDWTRPATAEVWGMPNPWAVAPRINDVAAAATAKIREMGIDPQNMTLIGESFGNYVNFRVAKELEGVDTLLVFNPASEMGGYAPPDMRGAARRTVAFASRSSCDTQRKIADCSLLLQTPDGLDGFAQHRWGIQWFCCTLQRQDLGWALALPTIPSADDTHFDGVVLADGSLDGTQPPLRLEPSPRPGQPEPAALASTVQQ